MRKRTMGKRTGAILLGGVLLALILAGCGGGRETEAAAEAEAEIMEDTAAQAAEEETEAPVPDQAAEDAEDAENAENAEAQETEAEAEEMQLTDEYLIEAAKEAGLADPSDSAAVARLRAFHGSINIDQISDLGQLQCFKGLAELEAHASTTYDIEWVGYLPQLKYLELEYNSLKDLSPLAGLEDLEVLGIEAYGIEDLEPLASLAQLKVLQVVSETVTDVSAVGRIASLQYIWLDCRHLSSLECDWGALENLNCMELNMPEAADYSSVLNVRFDAPTYERTGELEKMLDFLGMDGWLIQANRYRGEYDNEEVPDNVCFKCVVLDGDDARDKIDAEATARYNYDFLQKVDFHLDSYYQCIHYSEQENEAYRSAYEELIAANGDPLKPAPTVDADVHNSSSWENPAVFCDGVLYGFDIPIKEMLTDADGYVYTISSSYKVPKAKMEEILDNSVVRGKSGEDIKIYKNDIYIGIIRVRNSAEDTRYLGECEVYSLRFYNNEGIEVELPQGNEHAILVTLDRFTRDSISIPDKEWYKARSVDSLSFDVGDVHVYFPDCSSDSGYMRASQVCIEKKND